MPSTRSSIRFIDTLANNPDSSAKESDRIVQGNESTQHTKKTYVKASPKNTPSSRDMHDSPPRRQLRSPSSTPIKDKSRNININCQKDSVKGSDDERLKSNRRRQTYTDSLQGSSSLMKNAESHHISVPDRDVPLTAHIAHHESRQLQQNSVQVNESKMGTEVDGTHHEQLLWQERWNMALLVLLYMMQGVPLGLTTGAMPFMLQSKLSFTQVGVFSMAATPYSMKLLWSPIVDSCFSSNFGRRKSWIIPVQLITAAMLIFCSQHIESLYKAADVSNLTLLFTLFVFMAATQDIAVDGWALTLLSAPNVAYASTCQTIGTTLGYFTSFTVFLALNSGQFCDDYIRSWSLSQVLGLDPPGQKLALVTLQGYLQFWGWFFVLATVTIAFFKKEKNFTEEEEKERAKCEDVEQRGTAALNCALEPHKTEATPLNKRNLTTTKRRASSNGLQSNVDARPPVADIPINAPNFLQLDHQDNRSSVLSEVLEAYKQLVGVLRLPAVWGLSAFLLSYRLGFLSTEGAYSLKLIDKGVGKEALAFLVLLQFPVELGSAVLAGRWASSHSPFAPFITGYFLRLVVCGALLLITASFPPGAKSVSEHFGPFTLLAGVNLVQSFASTLTFTALGSLFNKVCDPAMGGAYLTLLNTIANMGYMLPRAPLFLLMDRLTTSGCADGIGSETLNHLAPFCPKKVKDLGAHNACTEAGGSCYVISDGFYIISWVCLAVGALLGMMYWRLLPILVSLPLSNWRAGKK
ncbi:hypothetical protein CEUSTIGMA_g3620.t1 [Chlamydomonas eustigma]|uniref:Uncharacterized protein n=1 Tax=Chlamydomonas eustigma TaxID=1157962 RepID=A0A250WZH0_9CHLO|nr:hypothetical protein CEUSTIGMA_g3620.t1 [Chlamydomonas eustigma]|eukprot:GAX76176.1 hypothetical protein CEUSTIGMA_g3620.t1 [Chlamydomonas eustigma]